MAKRHRKRNTQDGSGIFDVLKSGFKFVKDNGLVSKGLNVASNIAGALGKNDIANKLNSAGSTVGKAGFGRKRKHRTTHHQNGEGFTDVLGDIISGVSHLLGGKKHGKGVSLAGGRTRRHYGERDYTDQLNGIPSYHNSLHRGGALKLAGMGHHSSPFGNVSRGHAHMAIRH